MKEWYLLYLFTAAERLHGFRRDEPQKPHPKHFIKGEEHYIRQWLARKLRIRYSQ